MNNVNHIIGCDLSHWNNVTNYNLLSKHYKFAMIKFGGEEAEPGRLTRDSMFDRHYHYCKINGMDVGAYFFISNETSVLASSPKKIVNKFIDSLDNYEITMPVALDVEGKIKVTKETLTDYVIEWCKCVEERGYYAMIYSSDISGFRGKLDIDRLESYDKWVARYNKVPQYVKKFGMWQRSDSGGSTEYCYPLDINVAFHDYPSLIRAAGLNKLTY